MKTLAIFVKGPIAIISISFGCLFINDMISVIAFSDSAFLDGIYGPVSPRPSLP